MWGALKGGGAVGAKMAAFGGLWVGLEQGAMTIGDRVGGGNLAWVSEGREIIAGMGSAGVVLAGYRLPRPMWRQVIGLGVAGGVVLYAARRGREWAENRAADDLRV
ncbi:hypothetical protein FRC12_023231 [Ceratobasidium sp. 428]|nr:hypothetical protein FRC09_019714 [Ceratobasidium sp. 395]KAG8726618.1 hypothetical protein FRC12_023231 [Ceratobasidium sp. 428]